MSKIPEYIQAATDRINEFLPEPLIITALQKKTEGNIPFGLSGAYDFYEAKIMGETFLLCGIEEGEGILQPTVLGKQSDVLLRQTGLTPIFIFNKLQAYLFSRYTRRNLNIVVGNKQLFLPSLFLIAGKEKPSLMAEQEEKVPAIFQLIVLYHLQKEKVDGITMRDLASKLNVSYSTVNRALRWMKNHDFINLIGGKEKRIEFNMQGRALWESALKYMSSPIDFIVYTTEPKITDKALLSEQNALAEDSLLTGGPQRIAISKEVYNTIKDLVHRVPVGETAVEIWKYDPRLLSDTGIVDKLSLYLLLKDYEDERVQIELDNMMNDIVW